MSRNIVCKYIRRLKERELIHAHATNVFAKGDMKLNGDLLYTILLIEQSKRYFYKHQLENLNEL